MDWALDYVSLLIRYNQFYYAAFSWAIGSNQRYVYDLAYQLLIRAFDWTW